MMPTFSSLTMTEAQFRSLHTHLFPGDDKESAAVLLCGHAIRDDRMRLLAREVFPIPHHACTARTSVQLVWPSELMIPYLESARAKNLSVVKIHSHPTNIEGFSIADDASDADLFPSVHAWVDRPALHASVVMLPSG